MPYDLNSARILLIDDMKPMVTLTKSVLNIFGFKNVYVAHDGEEGFEMLCKYDPDLVITDWMMDNVDGLEFAKAVRNNPRAPNPYIPIIMMTGFSSKLRVEEARDNGITEFLVKPFSSVDLYNRIQMIIEKPRQFVKNEDFFGPDRRRRKGDDYEGPKRRENDQASKKSEKSDDKQKVAIEILKQLQKDAKGLSDKD